MQDQSNNKPDIVQVVDVSRLTKNTPASQGSGLFVARKKIFIREVKGLFNRWRWVFVALTQLIFYATPWLQWNQRQAILLDVVNRKFYFYGLVLWSSDVIYLTVLMIIGALALFLFTAVAGRLWCGYACPQTVYTEIFMWIERKIEGNRVAQLRLDNAPMSVSKAAKKTTKHFLWAIFALWSGFTLVGYFTPMRELFSDLMSRSLSSTEIFWTFFYGFMMYLLAGWMREQVCKYMCPYARFQSVMFDADTLIVTYDAARGESRGARKKGVDPRTVGKGDCIDCGVCVDVCPTGIDIRNGLQMECIGCGACIDGCNEIMDKMGYPKNLIRYDTENGLKHGLSKEDLLRRVVRGRILIYTAVLCALIAGMVYSLSQRSPITAVVERDSRTMARLLDDGTVENVYRVVLSNSDEAAHSVQVSAHGLNSIAISGQARFVLEPLSNNAYVLKVQANPLKAYAAGATKGSNTIELHIKDEADKNMVANKTTFLFPKMD